MITAVHENVRTLAAVLEIGEDRAEQMLDVEVVVTASTDDVVTNSLAENVRLLLSRTVRSVTRTPQPQTPPAVEVVIGEALPVTAAPVVWAEFTERRFTVGTKQVGSSRIAEIHPALSLLCACYVTGAAMRAVVGDTFPFPFSDPLVVDFDHLFGADRNWLYMPVDLEEAYLAGAGAVGNGFVFALRHFQVRGRLHVADPDNVSNGNLNRCLWFTSSDVGGHKAERLVSSAQPFFPQLRLIPHTVPLQDVPAARGGGPWLKRLIVGVDSRRARRNLQLEIPGEVFDASTTGIVEIVVHFHRAPTDGACLSCIYVQEEGELTHEAHVAESLGVTPEEVRALRVTLEAATKICLQYPQLRQEDLVGLAYDSLFKQLCGHGVLRTAADRQVLAPFALVSVLAGTYLARECVRRLQPHPERLFNYWRASPWCSPITRLRTWRPKNLRCAFCTQEVLQRVTRELWGRC